jgi:tetratricopeptide (TPR) repeat protein
MRQTIFISYSWSDSIIANQIDKVFQPTGLEIKRDIREIGYKGSIKDYMQQVRSTDFVFLIISDSFLKSANAMYEVLELLKDKNFKDKILPVIVDGTKIYKPDDRFEYIKFWTDKHIELETKLKAVNITDAIELYQDLKHYEKIRTTIGEFLGHLADTNSPTFLELLEGNFQKIFDYIGVNDSLLINEILSIGNFPTDEEKDIKIDMLEERYPGNSKIYVLKGIYSYERREISKSSYFYRKAIELDPYFPAAYYNLGFNVENYEKDYEQAIKLYEKSIDLDPLNIKAYINLAVIYSTNFANFRKARKLL